MNDTQPVEAGEFNMYTPVQRITLSGLASYPDVSGGSVDACLCVAHRQRAASCNHGGALR
jgi:hypothetical protein